MVDREKVLAVLLKRFPDAPPNDVAAAANAIVGLEPEYSPLAPPQLSRFECEVGSHSYAMRHLTSGEIRLFRRKPRD